MTNPIHKSIRAVIASLVGVTVKVPPAYDIAGSYETVADWSQVHPKPRIVFHKATEGTYYQDPKLSVDFAGMAANGIKRGAYHFHRKAYDATRQAQYFCNYIRGIITPADKLILDVEEGGETPTQIIQWLNEVENTFPNEILIYSRKNLLDPIIAQCTASQLTRLKQYRLWIAGYPLYPDNYSSIPGGYVPANLGSVVAWQYSENGIVSGINGEVDLDWLSPTFAAELSEVSPSVPDVTTTPYDGMTRVNGERNGYWFEQFKLDPAKFDFELVSTPQLETVPSVARRKGALLATNAGEWNDRDRTLPTYLKPIDYTVSNGVEIVARDRIAARPSLQILPNGFVYINFLNNTLGVEQAFTGVRYIVQNSTLPLYLFGTEPQYTEGHARACFGLDAAGNVMILLSEGVYPNQGLKLREAAAILQQYGAVTAFDGGGGGDVSGVLNGMNLIIPENIDNGQNVYRALPMTFCVYQKDVNMTDGIAKEKFGNQTRVRKTPSRYGEIVSTLAGYAQVNFTDKVSALVPTPTTTADKLGEMYLLRPDGYFVNYKLFNTTGVLTEMFTILQEPTVDTPPVVEYLESETIEPASGTVITKLYSTGRTERIVIP